MDGTDFTYIFSRYRTYLPHSYFNNSLPFPYSAMWFGHNCQTTWQNMEMGTEQFRNLQESGRCNRYVSGTKKNIFCVHSIIWRWGVLSKKPDGAHAPPPFIFFMLLFFVCVLCPLIALLVFWALKSLYSCFGPLKGLSHEN